MGNDHKRFRASMPGYLLDLLPDADQTWSDAHAATCSECATLLEGIRSRIPELQDEAGHVPVRVLEAYALEADRLTPLERELVRRHLKECADCREDAHELSRVAGVPQATPKRVQFRMAPSRALTAGLAAAAMLAVVFAVRFVSWRSSGAPTRLSPPSAGPTSQPTATTVPLASERPPITSELVTLRERMRGSDNGAIVEAGVPERGSGVRLRVPRLFLGEGDRVQLRLVRADGSVPWTKTLEASDLTSDLEPTTPAAGWAPGLYRLEIIPGVGADTLAKRVFEFSLVRHR